MQKETIQKTILFVKEKLEKDGTGHDWLHIDRVHKNAKKISSKESGNLFVIELGALLHDIQDWKFSKSKQTLEGAQIAYNWLISLNVPSNICDQVKHIVENISFKGANVENKINSLEGKIVQDADRLDAMGAIGIARTFAYGGFKQRPIYSPNIKPQIHNSFEEYKKQDGTAVNHFYEKLLLLKDKMNTETGKLLAEKRHDFMNLYLDQFFDEIK